ncbi:MAG: hypothetical protein [Caudoviricetes sp.]|nr:MAG: hypothetical protein [Caudoviricetes sp.]
MKKSIYKITNLINNKIYIGQSINPKKRLKQHGINFGSKGGLSHSEESLINKAIRKYGLENFGFEILEEQIENYNEREIYWIKYYDSNNREKGYNITVGGENPPIRKGEDNSNAQHTQKEINEIKKLLKESNLSIVEISKKYNYKSCAVISSINQGKSWRNENEQYPLREVLKRVINQQNLREIVYDLLYTELTQLEIANKYRIGRHVVTAINTGSNHNIKELSYPLRDNIVINKHVLKNMDF